MSTRASTTASWRPRSTGFRAAAVAQSAAAERAFAAGLRRVRDEPVRRRPQPRLRRARGQARDGAARARRAHPPPAARRGGRRRAAPGGAARPPPAVACVSASQASAWRRIVPVDAVLPSLIPTRRIPFSLDRGIGRAVRRQVEPREGRRRGDRHRARGRRRDRRLRRQPTTPTTRGSRSTRAAPSRASAFTRRVPQTALWEAMARAAVVLCPAQWEEPFGMVAAEAQACGTPVVAFRRGALAEVIVDGVTGFLVAPGDVERGGRRRQAGRRAVPLGPAASTPSARWTSSAASTPTKQLYGRVAGARPGRGPVAEARHWLAGTAGGGHRRQPRDRRRHRGGARGGRRPRRAGGARHARRSTPSPNGSATPAARRRRCRPTSAEPTRSSGCSPASRRSGPLGALVCAAGVLTSGAVRGDDSELGQQTLEVNLTGSFLCCRAAFSAMRRRAKDGSSTSPRSPASTPPRSSPGWRHTTSPSTGSSG